MRVPPESQYLYYLCILKSKRSYIVIFVYLDRSNCLKYDVRSFVWDDSRITNVQKYYRCESKLPPTYKKKRMIRIEFESDYSRQGRRRRSCKAVRILYTTTSTKILELVEQSYQWINGIITSTNRNRLILFKIFFLHIRSASSYLANSQVC